MIVELALKNKWRLDEKGKNQKTVQAKRIHKRVSLTKGIYFGNENFSVFNTEVGRAGWGQIENILEYQVNEFGLYTVENRELVQVWLSGK